MHEPPSRPPETTVPFVGGMSSRRQDDDSGHGRDEMPIGCADNGRFGCLFGGPLVSGSVVPEEDSSTKGCFPPAGPGGRGLS